MSETNKNVFLEKIVLSDTKINEDHFSFGSTFIERYVKQLDELNCCIQEFFVADKQSDFLCTFVTLKAFICF
jgi:hypothetical protein